MNEYLYFKGDYIYVIYYYITLVISCIIHIFSEVPFCWMPPGFKV